MVFGLLNEQGKTFLLGFFLCSFLFSGPVTAYAEDPDSDGFSTEYEELIGTDPEDASSRPTLADNQYKILGYWPLSENAEEVLGLGIDGSLRNGAVFESGALSLDGIDDYLNFGNDPLLSLDSDISISLWLKPEGRWGLERIIGKYDQDSQREYAVFTKGDGQFWMFLSQDGESGEGSSILDATDKDVLVRNEWQHFSMTWDAARGKAGLTSYLNSEPLSLYEQYTSDINYLHNGTADMTLGTYDVEIKTNNGKNGKTSEKVQNPFRGKMAQLLLCHAGLTQIEVRELTQLTPGNDISEYLNADYDEDGLPDWWERRYFGNILPGAEDDNDEDGIDNSEEYSEDIDPTDSDTDNDGFADDYDNQKSRVYITGDEAFTAGDEYVYPQPEWLLSIWKEDSQWHSWYVDPATENDVGALYIALDREILTTDVVLEIEYWVFAGSTLYADLLALDLGDLGLNDLYGNIMDESTGEIINSTTVDGFEVIKKRYTVSLAENPDAAVLKIRRGSGEILVSEIMIYVDQDGDGLDAGQETLVGTSDLSADSDGDSLPDGEEVFDHGTDPTADDNLLDNDGDGVSNVDEINRGTGINDEADVNIVIYADSTQGNDSYDGYAATWDGEHGPKKTISAAVQMAVDGDTINIAAGTYSELPAVYNVTGKNLTIVPLGNVTVRQP